MVSATSDGPGPAVAGRFSDASDGSTWDASENAKLARLRRRGKVAPHADGTAQHADQLPRKYARDAGKARESYWTAVTARVAQGLDGATLRAADGAAWARNARARTDRRVDTDGRMRGKTARLDGAAYAARRAAWQNSLPGTPHAADRIDPSLARGMRQSTSDAILASRHGADRKSDATRPIPLAHLASPVATMGPGARILHVDPAAVGPLGHVRPESQAERAVYLRDTCDLARACSASDTATLTRIARAVVSLRASGLACAESRVFAACGHSARKALARVLGEPRRPHPA
jgi:hypothetical protein